jgi:hypothetical protein
MYSGAGSRGLTIVHDLLMQYVRERYAVHEMLSTEVAAARDDLYARTNTFAAVRTACPQHPLARRRGGSS